MLQSTMKGFFASSKVQRARPEDALVPRCGSCGLYKGCKSPKMPDYGKGRKRVLVVGEAPGETEDEEGRPFIGKAGQYLRSVLHELDVDLDRDAVTTNSLICRPPHNETPEPVQVDYCRPNLIQTIKDFGPRVIVPLGRVAVRAVLGPYYKDTYETLEPWLGWRIPLPDFWVCPSYHPSYLIRRKDEQLDKQFFKHLALAFAIDEYPPKSEDYASRVQCIYDPQEAASAIRGISQQGLLTAVDIETNCLKPEYPKAKIVSCALSNGEETISYPWVGEAVDATVSFLENPHTPKVAANLKFEDRWFRKLAGAVVSPWRWDTMIATHCIDNRPGITSLKFQALIQFGVATYNANIEPYLENEGKGKYNRIHEISMSDLLLYGGLDALLEWELAKRQRRQFGYAD